MKKTIAIILLFLLSGICYAQSNSFAGIEGRLMWENVFVTSEDNIPLLISQHSKLKITSSENNIYKGVATGVSNSCPGVSKNLKNKYSFDFEIEVTEGKYSVTISNIVFHPKKGKNIAAGKIYLNTKTDDLITTAQTDLDCLDAYFNKIFSMTVIYKNKL